MTTSNKVAALPNPNLAVALAGIFRSETSACLSCRSSALSYTTKSNPSSKIHILLSNLQCPPPF
jgi:hypothetical protein